MRCPKCQTDTLHATPIQGKAFMVETCSNCRGIWFDPAELKRLMTVAIDEVQIPERAETTSLACPKCAAALSRFDYPQTDILVEMCPACGGLWLDSGEMKQIRLIRESLDTKGDLEPDADDAAIRRVTDSTNESLNA